MASKALMAGEAIGWGGRSRSYAGRVVEQLVSERRRGAERLLGVPFAPLLFVCMRKLGKLIEGNRSVIDHLSQ